MIKKQLGINLKLTVRELNVAFDYEFKPIEAVKKINFEPISFPITSGISFSELVDVLGAFFGFEKSVVFHWYTIPNYLKTIVPFEFVFGDLQASQEFLSDLNTFNSLNIFNDFLINDDEENKNSFDFKKYGLEQNEIIFSAILPTKEIISLALKIDFVYDDKREFDEDFQIDPELISQSVISERKETLKYLKELKQNEFKNFHTNPSNDIKNITRSDFSKWDELFELSEKLNLLQTEPSSFDFKLTKIENGIDAWNSVENLLGNKIWAIEEAFPIERRMSIEDYDGGFGTKEFSLESELSEDEDPNEKIDDDNSNEEEIDMSSMDDFKNSFVNFLEGFDDLKQQAKKLKEQIADNKFMSGSPFEMNYEDLSMEKLVDSMYKAAKAIGNVRDDEMVDYFKGAFDELRGMGINNIPNDGSWEKSMLENLQKILHRDLSKEIAEVEEKYKNLAKEDHKEDPKPKSKDNKNDFDGEIN